jgi:hypothetical protein
VLRKQCALCVEKEERKEAPDHLPCCKVDRAIREDPKSYVVRVEVGSKVPMFDEVYVRDPNLFKFSFIVLSQRTKFEFESTLN